MKYVYTDDSNSLKCALRQLGIPHDVSAPGRPKTNGVAERQVKEVIHGTRVMLRQAGIPDCFWPYAMRNVCFARNIHVNEKSLESPFFRRHGYEFEGKNIPFGARVEFHPSPTTKSNDAA